MESYIWLAVVTAIYIAIAIFVSPLILPVALIDIGYYLGMSGAPVHKKSRKRKRHVRFKLTDSQRRKQQQKQNPQCPSKFQTHQSQFQQPQFQQRPQPQPQPQLQPHLQFKPPAVIKLDTIPEVDIETDSSNSERRPIDIDTYQSSCSD